MNRIYCFDTGEFIRYASPVEYGAYISYVATCVYHDSAKAMFGAVPANEVGLSDLAGYIYIG